MADTIKNLWQYLIQNIPFINKKPPNTAIKVIPFSPGQKFALNRSKMRIQNERDIKLVQQECVQLHEKGQQIQFKIVYSEQSKDVSSISKQQEDNVIYDLLEIEELRKQFQKLMKDVLKKQKKIEIKDLQSIRQGIQRKKLQHIGLQYKDGYKRDILSFRALKYSKEKKHYPLIDFSDYHRLKDIWFDAKRNKGAQQIKRSSSQTNEKLTYKTMQRLEDGKWLNDDLINKYIDMLEKQAKRIQNMEIFNTYFATTTIGKSQKVLNRYLAKKNIVKTSTILIPINHQNIHWYFARLNKNQLMIHDSLKKSYQQYQNNNVIKTLLKFGKQFFDEDISLDICQQYPQQDNGFDCGVFMLMGLRDVMESSQWSFLQGDIKFKRIQTSIQILKQKLYPIQT